MKEEIRIRKLFQFPYPYDQMVRLGAHVCIVLWRFMYGGFEEETNENSFRETQ